MSGLSRSLRFAGQAISKERYAKGVKSGAFAYHPKTIQRLELLEFRRAVIDQYAPEMKPRDRQLIYEWMRQRARWRDAPGLRGRRSEQALQKTIRKI